MVSCRQLVALRVLSAVLAAVLMQGCGLKADPSPRYSQPLKAATEVQSYEKTDNGSLPRIGRHPVGNLPVLKNPGDVPEQTEDSI